MSSPRLIAVFEHEDHLLAAARAVREDGGPIIDAHTPYAVHGLDEAMGLRVTRLPIFSFICGLSGAAFILWFQFWSTAVDWPINVGGKPWNSLVAFVPVTFEVMVLCSGLGSVLALLVSCRLFPGKRAVLPTAGVTDNRFALVLGAPDARHSIPGLIALCKKHHAVSVTEVTERTPA